MLTNRLDKLNYKAKAGLRNIGWGAKAGAQYLGWGTKVGAQYLGWGVKGMAKMPGKALGALGRIRYYTCYDRSRSGAWYRCFRYRCN